MKNLLSLLSVLTISGTAVPTTIATIPYQKEKNIENSGSYINHQKINNLENLIRNKREDLGLSVVSVVDKIGSFGVILDNKLYFGTDGSKVYEYDLITNQKKVVINTDNLNTWVRGGAGLTWNNKVYFAAADGKIYEYNIPKYNLNNFIKTTNLQHIENNTNNAILNELNYLNAGLDISQLEVINKTNTSAIIKPKSNSNKYFGEKKIYYTLNNQQNKIINLDELIKKGIFLNFRDKNIEIIKETKNINKDSLVYYDVIATKDIEPLYIKNNKSICFGTTILFHNLPEKQKMKTPSCKYTKETTISTEIITGLGKEETNSKTSDMKHNWNFELGVNIHGEAGVWPFAKVSTDISTKIGAGGEYGSSETKTLSNRVDFSDNKKMNLDGLR